MNLTKKILSTGAIAAAMTLAMGLQPTIVAAAPQLTPKQEAAAHPRIEKAVKAMEDAIKALEAAPIDFGGNKAAAIKDTQQAIHSLKKALYYRLKMDDAAIDKAQ